jgi:hypothetical protein
MYGNKWHALGRIKRKNRCLRMGFSTIMEAYLMSSSLAAASTAAATSAMILKYITQKCRGKFRFKAEKASKKRIKWYKISAKD